MIDGLRGWITAPSKRGAVLETVQALCVYANIWEFPGFLDFQDFSFVFSDKLWP